MTRIDIRVTAALLTAAMVAAGCAKAKDEGQGGKTEPGAAGAPTAEKVAPEAKVDTADLEKKVGVQPGPIDRKGEGAAATLAAVDGTVEVRRLGEETFAAAKAKAALYPGDQVRTADGAKATVVFADDSTAEIAEASTLAIGTRVATADPASTGALLAGVARFSISARAPAEGPFLVFLPSAVVATKGTVFGAGVAVDGDARVGVETGAVEVAGLAAFDAPVTVEAGNAIAIEGVGDGAGAVAAATPWPADDWGTWRADADASIEIDAAADAHVDAMAKLTGDLEAAYAQLESLGKAAATFEAEASADASAGDVKGYQGIVVDGAATIDASFLTALRLELLTHAYASHAVIATDLHVRHPDVVVWADIAPSVSAAVLWPKRLDITASAYLEPLRVQYYLHHPRGRANAQFVGVVVPEFYAQVTPPEVPTATVEGKLDWKAFVVPAVAATATARAVWIARPSLDWNAKAKIHAAPPRAKVAFWVRPPDLKAKAILGADIKAKLNPVFQVRPPVARADLKLGWAAGLGTKIKVAPPDLKAAAAARANFNVAVPDVRADAKARLDVKVPDVKAKVKVAVPDVKAKVKAGADVAAGAAAKAKAGIKAGASVKVKAPEIKVKAPSVKVKAGAKAKASGGFKLGN